MRQSSVNNSNADKDSSTSALNNNNNNNGMMPPNTAVANNNQNNQSKLSNLDDLFSQVEACNLSDQMHIDKESIQIKG